MQAGRLIGPGPGDVRGAGQHQPLLRVLDERVQQHADRRHDHVPDRRVGLARRARSTAAAASASRRPDTWLGQQRPQRGDASSVTSSSSSTIRCSTRPVSVMTTSSSRRGSSATASTCRTSDRASVGYCTTATCRVSWASSRTERRSTSSRSTASDRKRLDRLALAGGQRLDLRQPVDEQPVALVGGDPAGGGVRLRDVALVLEHRHVVADGGRRDAEVVPIDQRLGADRLAGGDVVGDDRAEHLETPVVRRHRSPPGRSTELLGSASRCTRRAGRRVLALRTACQVYVGLRTVSSRGCQRTGPSCTGGRRLPADTRPGDRRLESDRRKAADDDLQGRPRRPAVPRSRPVHARLGADPAAAGPDGRARSPPSGSCGWTPCSTRTRPSTATCSRTRCCGSGEIYLEDGLHRALRAALQQRTVIHVRVLDLDDLRGRPPARRSIRRPIQARPASRRSARRRVRLRRHPQRGSSVAQPHTVSVSRAVSRAAAARCRRPAADPAGRERHGARPQPIRVQQTVRRPPAAALARAPARRSRLERQPVVQPEAEQDLARCAGSAPSSTSRACPGDRPAGQRRGVRAPDA